MLTSLVDCALSKECDNSYFRLPCKPQLKTNIGFRVRPIVGRRLVFVQNQTVARDCLIVERQQGKFSRTNQFEYRNEYVLIPE